MGIHWDVTGIDADDFSNRRSRHVLMFNSPPNYESPTDREWDARSSNNDLNHRWLHRRPL